MKSTLRTAFPALAVSLVLALAPQVAAAAVLTLAPGSGALAGFAGTTVGWGFTLSNATDFAVVSSSNFCLGSSGMSSACISSTLGTYTDYVATNFTVAGPSPENPVVTQAFDASTATGTGAFAINTSEPIGAMSVGQIVASYDLYSVDPNAANFDPVADLISAGNYLTAPASITVGSVPPVTTPEPAYGLLTIGLLVAFALRRR